MLIFSSKEFSMIDSHLSRGCFFRQATHNSRAFVLLLSAMMTYVVNLFLLCLGFCCEPSDDLSQYWSITEFEKGGHLSAMPHLSMSIKSTRTGFLNGLLLILNICLTHLSLDQVVSPATCIWRQGVQLITVCWLCYYFTFVRSYAKVVDDFSIFSL